MQNHNDIVINYNPVDILNVLPKYDPPVDKWTDVSACSAIERQKIASILNLGLPIISILYFRMGKNFTGLIHKDLDISPKYKPTYSLTYAVNLPLSNCTNVYMKWFNQTKYVDNNISTFPGPSTGSATPIIDYSKVECIDNVSCESPKLVKVNDWHSIENHSMETCEYLISIRFNNEVNPSMNLPMNEWLLKVGSNH